MNEATSAGDVSTTAIGRGLWHTMDGRFASCLGVSTRILTDLMSAPGWNSDRQRRVYDKTVQLMTCARHATSNTKCHAVVAMCFTTFAYVIDHALHLTTMRIPLDDEFYMSPYIPLFGPESQMRFMYFLTAGEYKLTMDDGSSKKLLPSDLYIPQRWTL